MADWDTPTTSSTYSGFVTEINAKFADVARMFDGLSPTNLPTDAIRFNGATGTFQSWDGAAWGELTTSYILDSGGTFDGPVAIDVSDTGAALRVTQRGTGLALLIEDETNPDSSPFLINAAGALVTGHTGRDLEWYSSSNANYRIFSATAETSAGGGLFAVNYSTTADAGGGINLARSRGASIGARATVADADLVGRIAFSADDGSAGTVPFQNAAAIDAVVDGTPSTGIVPGMLRLRTADSAGTLRNRVHVTSTGTLALQATYSGGIKFPITQVAVADANTLDDYEEGTFTPTARGTGTVGAGTYTKQVGRYQKIGNRCHFSITLAWTAHTGTTNLRIGGLPFTSANVTDAQPALAVWADSLTFTGQLAARINSNATTLDLQSISTGAAAAGVAMDTAAEITITGAYEVA
jgi:hypothetical protein